MKDKRQELRSNFDDAYLALLMDELCEEEGALLWEECEQLNANPEAAVPESLHKKCVALIEQHYAQEKRRQRRVKSRAVIRKILIAAAVLTVLFTTAFATIEEFRVGVLNFALKVQEKYSTLVFSGGNNESVQPAIQKDNTTDDAIRFGNGQIEVLFELEEFDVLENQCDENGVFAYLYADESDKSIMIQSSKIVAGMDFQVDTENADSISEIRVKDNQGYMIVKDTWNHVVWADSRNNVMLEVVTKGLGEEFTMLLAESITYVGEK